MDPKDCDSPLRGLLNSPVKRITPAVPVPDWKSFTGRPVPSSVGARGTVPSPLLIDHVNRQSSIQINSPLTSPDPNCLQSSVLSYTANSTSNRHSTDPMLRLGDLPHNIPDAAFDSTSSASDISQPKQLSNTEKLPQTPSQLSRISGDVTFTPTHSAFTPSQNAQNPHATMVAQTPIASGPTQAINSIKLQNCVSTVNMCCELKLLDIYCRTRFSEYNPSRFHGVVMRILEPRATALVFRSGKLVCTGTKNEHDSLLAARKFSRIIQRLGNPVRFTEFKIQNFVATADLRFPVRLEALQQAHGQFTSYEPELFPGLIYRMVRPRIVLLIFVNGKIVFTGGKSRNDITEALNIIYPILRSFKKN